MSAKRLIVLTDEGCEKPFQDMFDQILGRVPDSLTKDDVLLLEGGTDIDPSYYNDSFGSFCYLPNQHRDVKEHTYIKQFIAVGGKILGICRGAQWACIAAGGTLIQHVTGHGNWHGHTIQVPAPDGRADFMVASTVHHQMMYPFMLPKDHFDLLGWTPRKLSTRYLDGKDRDFPIGQNNTAFKEPEIVWFPKIQALAIQGHPEYMKIREKFVKHSRKLVQSYLLEEVVE